MNPVSPDAENDDLQKVSDDSEHSEANEVSEASEVASRSQSAQSSGLINQAQSTDHSQSDASQFSRSNTIAGLQSEYIDQLSHDIEQLEAQKNKLRREVSVLRLEYAHLQAQTQTAEIVLSDHSSI